MTSPEKNDPPTELSDFTFEELGIILSVKKYHALHAAGLDLGFTPEVLMRVLLCIHSAHAELERKSGEAIH
ncbi:hypothetical protein APY04_1867 [Hyphomicrobium sulfonivorans]|uniref:Uncharacterized protein n=1 Tax=Hyphomicrobium sulfonivorans TaxID=121290 RepID=A0A109BEU5_HYPSL|nr:hypothetical protein [Hyphomicrobium sulfonivorans]KWT67508.1 hypothetical protein APY04_1867 [Hyphomicrobium sulfonivorans]